MCARACFLRVLLLLRVLWHQVDFVLTAMTASTAPIMNKRQEPTPEIELEYAKLARYVGRLFYARKNQGLHCVLLNLLTKHEWIKVRLFSSIFSFFFFFFFSFRESFSF